MFMLQVSRALDYRLQWNKNNQNIFGTQPVNAEEDADPDNVGGQSHTDEQTFLSQSFHGSRRHLRRLATDALTIVTEIGRPTFFITFTLNTNWPEFNEQLLPGQTPYGNSLTHYDRK